MWFYICFSIVFVQVLGISSIKNDPRRNHKNSSLHDKDIAFDDVIKNISRVNNVLQELISNYKNLQNIYKSQEELETVSSDDEVEKVHYKNKNNKRAKNKETTTGQYASYSVTKMIYWSSHETSDSSEKLSLEKTEQKPEKVSKNSKEYDDEQMKPPVEAKLASKQIDSSSESESKEKPQSKTKENIETYEIIRDNISTELPILNEDLEPKRSEIVFIDTHKTTSAASNTSYVTLEKEHSHSIKGLKTRYSKVYSRSKTNNKRIRTSKSEDKFDGNRPPSELIHKIHKSNTNHKNTVEKEIPSRTPLSIWDSIIFNKPIQKEAEKGITYKKLHKDNLDTRKAILRNESIEKKELLEVNVTHKNIRQKIKPIRKPHLSIDASATEEDIVKEEFKASVLREAYGDACLKVVVRKCFKACKAAGKTVCESFKCLSTYKTKYEQFAKTGCINEFEGNVKNNTKVNEKAKQNGSKSKKKRGVKNRADENENDNNFSDFTRDGYLRACLPKFEAKIKRTYDLVAEKSYSLTNITETRKNFNILRDKYEDACKRVSYDKCLKACEFAYTEVCKSFTCNSSRINRYRKSCNRKCKEAYDFKSSDSRSGSSSGSSDDDTGSDSDSASGSDIDSSGTKSTKSRKE